MLEINPKDLSTKDLHGYLLSSVGPRPIALVSTIDSEGRPNLSPFSFLMSLVQIHQSQFSLLLDAYEIIQ